MNIAITGTTGFVGGHLYRVLKQSDHNVFALNRSEGYDVTKVDSLISFVDSLDIVIHTAALTFTPDSYNNVNQFLEVNAQGTANVLELAKQKGARFIYISSYVYGAPEYLPVDEKHPTNMYNPYSGSKLLGEMNCKIYNQVANIPVTIIRPFNIYGSGQNDRFLLSKIIKQAHEGKVSLFDPRPKRDFLHVDDLVRLIEKLIDYNHEGLEVFNAAYGKSYGVSEIVDLVEELGIIGHEFEVEYSNERRPNEVLDTQGSAAKAEKILGWKASVTLEEGLTRMAATFKKTQNEE